VALADQPAEDMTWVGRVGDARFGRTAIDREDVVLRDRAPMCLAVAEAHPAFDAREQPLDPWPVALDRVAVARLLVMDRIALPIASPASVRVLLEDRHQVFGPGEDEHIGFLLVAVLRQALVRLPGDAGQGQAPADTKWAVAGAGVV